MCTIVERLAIIFSTPVTFSPYTYSIILAVEFYFVNLSLSKLVQVK